MGLVKSSLVTLVKLKEARVEYPIAVRVEGGGHL